MAAAAARVEYAGRAVYGSEAYDLDRVATALPMPEEEYAPLPTPEELQRERIRERLLEREQARAKEKAKTQVFGIPVLGIIGALAAAVLMISVGFVELAAISGEISQVRSSISALEDKNEALRIKYEETFDMAQIEAYAVNILGMTRPEDGGNVYYSVYMSDRAEILAEDETAGFFAQVVGFLKEIPEYFR